MKKRIGAIIIILLLIIIFLSGQLHAQVPKIDSVFPLKGSIGSLMTIKGSKMNYSKTVTIGNTSELIISENDSRVVVMIMPGTLTDYIKIISFSNGQSIYADNFVVVVSTPPIKQLGKRLFDSTVSSDPQEGTSVAISADGNTAVVGGQYANDGAGGIWIYTRNNNVWTQQGNELSGTGATGNAYQGYSVAISADGNTIIEGGVGDNGFTGAAWIFTRDNNNVWSQQGNKLVGSNSIIIQGTTPEQGYAVSISADGNTAIIGGRRDSNYVGAAWIFMRSNDVWTEQQKLIGTGYINVVNKQGTLIHESVQMGSSVAVSADGNTVFIGGPNDNDNTGAVWVFTRSGNTFLQQGNKLVGTGGDRSFLGGIQQGTSVATSADGNIIIVGGPFDLDSTAKDITDNYYNGAAWIFTRNGSTWSQQGNKIFASDASQGAEQGWSVSISADGNTAIVGAPTDSGYVGGSWVYTHNANGWIQASNKLLGTGYVAAPKEGWSVNISADGNTAIVGGPENNPLGAAWVFADTSKSVLAVSSLNFSAYLFNKGVQTSWTGFNEVNISNYVVERSADGYHFISIGNVSAKSNTSKNNYAWFDVSPLNGNNFYRLKAINKDGSIQYSSIIKINFDNEVQGSIVVYPNPVIDKTIHLHLNNIIAGNYIISIHNTSGETLYRQNFQHVGGSKSVPIILRNSTAGVYHVELKNSSNVYQTTMVIQ